jgi:hypothetical protein
MTFAPVIIDFDAITQALLDVVEAKASFNYSVSINLDSTYIKELRTIGVYAPRQTGKTHYVAGMVNNNDDCVAIVPNQLIKSNMTSRGTDPNKVATSQDLLNMNSERAKEFFKKKVIVDESGYVFDRIRRNKFYKLVADSVGRDALVILIN